MFRGLFPVRGLKPKEIADLSIELSFRGLFPVRGLKPSTPLGGFSMMQ